MKYLLAMIMLFTSPLSFAAASISVEGLLSVIVYLIIIGLIFWCIWWFLGYVGVPEPFNKVIRVILGLIALVLIINLLLGLAGTPIFTVR